MFAARIRSILAAGLLAAAAAAPALPASAADPYEINVIIPLTGPAAFLGKEEASGLNILAESVNRSGGIAGRPLKFVVADDQTNPQIAVQLAGELIAKKVPVILGSSIVASCSAMAPLATNGPLIYCFSPGIHPVPGSFLFSSSISTWDYLVAGVRYMRERGWKNIAFVTTNDATGQDAEKGLDAAVALPENSAVRVVDRERFNAADLGVAAQLARVKAAGAQAVILWATGTPFGTLLREAAQTGLAIPLIGTAANLNYNQMQAYQSFLPDNLYLVAPPWAESSRVTNRAVRRFIGSYLDAIKAAGERPGMGHSLAWDPASIVVEALRHIGPGATAVQLRDYVAGARGFVGINGVYDFRGLPQRGVGQDWIVMVRYEKATGAVFALSKPGGMPL